MGAGVILMAYNEHNEPYLLGLIGDTKHRRKHGATYDLPKGTADDGERQIDCAIRETFEETGVVVGPEDFIAGPFKTSFLDMWIAIIDINERIVIEKNPESGKYEHDGYDWLDEQESWALSAGHVCYPEYQDQLVMWTEMWMHMGFDTSGTYEPIFIIALDQVTDVCVFRIPIGNLPAVPLAKKMPSIGSKVFLGAYPLGVYSPGHVPFFEGFYAGILDGRASYTIPVTGGASGGGVVNSKGELLGVVSMAIEGFENITLVSKLENVQTMLDVAKKNPERLTIVR